MTSRLVLMSGHCYMQRRQTVNVCVQHFDLYKLLKSKSKNADILHLVRFGSCRNKLVQLLIRSWNSGSWTIRSGQVLYTCVPQASGSSLRTAVVLISVKNEPRWMQRKCDRKRQKFNLSATTVRPAAWHHHHLHVTCKRTQIKFGEKFHFQNKVIHLHR